MGGAWPVGEPVVLSPLGSSASARGTLVWSRGGEVAMRFDRSDAFTRTTAARLLIEVSRGWERATQVQHPAYCPCLVGGAVLEPTLPRVSRRAAG